jgi:hypothetical protein
VTVIGRGRPRGDPRYGEQANGVARYPGRRGRHPGEEGRLFPRIPLHAIILMRDNSPGALGKGCGSRAASREDAFSRSNILGIRRSNEGTGIHTRSIEEAANPIRNGVAEPGRRIPPPRTTYKTPGLICRVYHTGRGAICGPPQPARGQHNSWS